MGELGKGLVTRRRVLAGLGAGVGVGLVDALVIETRWLAVERHSVAIEALPAALELRTRCQARMVQNGVDVVTSGVECRTAHAVPGQDGAKQGRRRDVGGRMPHCARAARTGWCKTGSTS